jgi:hypothetical protein
MLLPQHDNHEHLEQQQVAGRVVAVDERHDDVHPRGRARGATRRLRREVPESADAAIATPASTAAASQCDIGRHDNRAGRLAARGRWIWDGGGHVRHAIDLFAADGELMVEGTWLGDHASVGAATTIDRNAVTTRRRFLGPRRNRRSMR